MENKIAGVCGVDVPAHDAGNKEQPRSRDKRVCSGVLVQEAAWSKPLLQKARGIKGWVPFFWNKKNDDMHTTQ